MCKRLSIITSFVLVLGLVGNASALLNYEYYEAAEGAQYNALADVEFGVATPLRVGTSDTLDSGDGNWVEQADGHRGEDFAFRFLGHIVIPVSGETTFYLRSDDGSQLFIDGTMVVDNDGLHGTEAFPGDPGAITLDAGVYTFEATMFERGGGDSIHVAWSHGSFGVRRVPDSVLFVDPPADISVVPPTVLVETKAVGPNPSDGAVDSEATALEWGAGYGAVTHKVYLSTDETIDDADLIGEPDIEIQVAVLDPGVTYYWRVDEVDADGNVVEGDVWSFATLPLTAHFPSPADAAEYQALDSQLSWTPGKDTIMHNVNFGTDPAALLPVSMMQMDASYDPGPLDLETTYYWSVDEFTPAGTVAGPVWSFTTLGGIEITNPNLVLYYDFETGEGPVALDQSGHSNHGTLAGDPQWVSGIFGGAMDFDGDGDYVDGGNDTILDITDGFTLSVWINWRATGATWQTVVAKGDNAWRLARGGDTQTMDFGFTAGGDRGWQAARTASEVPLGEWHLVTATYDTIDGAKIYLDGVLEGTNPDLGGITVGAYPVFVGDNSQQNGRNWNGLIDEVRVYNVTLTAAQIQGMVMSDVTAPGDNIVPLPFHNSPPSGAEDPPMAIDDDVSTKYLNFEGAIQPSGFAVEPAMGPTVVTGLTLTTANDDYGRDPISFELSGSNESIDGPYELIADGNVPDFAQPDVWPRFTMNATAISFDNAVGYKYYQVMFPAVRDVTAANSMQIAEVELLGVPAPVARWDFDGVFAASGSSGQTGIPVGDVAFEADPARGLVLSLPGGDDQFVDLGSVGISGNMPKTIACWAKADHTDIPNWTLIFGFTGKEDGDGGNGSHFNIGSLGGPGGVGAHCWGWEETIFSDDEALEWHHYAMTYDGTTIQYYGDGALMDTDLGKSNVQNLSASADRVHAGSRITQASSFPGKVDDARVYMQALSALQIRDIASAPALSGPVAYWSLDDGAGAAALDSSGNLIDGAVVGEPLWVSGMLGGALELDGVDDYVDCGNPAALDFATGDFAVSAWIKLTAIERATVFAKGGDNGGGIRYTLAMGESNDNKMTLTTDDDSAKRQARGDTVVNDGAWHHVVGMRSGNTSLVYVDGALDGSLDLPEGYDLSGSSQHNALIGAITSHTDGSLEKLFAGTIDDVRVYDRALSNSEVVSLAKKTGNIIWVDGDYDDNGDGAVDDLEWVDILTAEGYAVDNSESYVELDDAKIAALNAADLIIVSRNSNSGDYDDGEEPTQWNAITTPIILSSTHIVRSSRWKWVDSTSILNLAPVMELADATTVVAMDEAVGPSSFIDAVVANGTVLATGDGLPWIFEFETGVEYYDGAGQIAGGPRMFFTAGTQEDTAAVPMIGRGEMNLTPEGLDIFLGKVATLITQ